jgi:Family of unknown function (DUF6522)
MTKLEILNDAVHIDASIVAQGLGFEPSFVQTMMREGRDHQLVRTRRGRGRGAPSADVLPQESTFLDHCRRDWKGHQQARKIVRSAFGEVE